MPSFCERNRTEKSSFILVKNEDYDPPLDVLPVDIKNYMNFIERFISLEYFTTEIDQVVVNYTLIFVFANEGNPNRSFFIQLFNKG